MKIQLGKCRRCQDVIYLVEEVGLVWTADMTPIDAQEALSAVLGGQELYRVTQPGPHLRTASPAVLKALRGEPGERPTVVASHRCPPGAAEPLRRTRVAQEADPCPKGRENGVQGAARAVPAVDATPRRSEACSCASPTPDGRHATVRLDQLVALAQHLDTHH